MTCMVTKNPYLSHYIKPQNRRIIFSNIKYYTIIPLPAPLHLNIKKEKKEENKGNTFRFSKMKEDEFFFFPKFFEMKRGGKGCSLRDQISMILTGMLVKFFFWLNPGKGLLFDLVM